MPQVSIIIPAYNSAATIGETLRSLDAQDYRDFEVIVVDDGSSDGTASLVEREFPAIRLVRQDNAGPAGARNTGVGQACGEWIAFLDADDVWLPWRLSLQIACSLRHPEVALWCGRTTTFATCDDDLRQQGPTNLPPGDLLKARNLLRPIDLRDLRFANPIATSTVLLRKAAFVATAGFDLQFRGPEDYDLWIRVLARFPAAKIQLPVSRYRETADGLSQDERRFLPEVLRVLDKAYGPDGELRSFGKIGYRQAKAYQLAAMAWTARMAGRHQAARQLLLRSLVAWPGWLPGYKLLFGRLRMLARILVGPAT